MEENAGTRFGNYQLVKRIDVGGMGEVYLAHQLTAFGRLVAIKIIRSDLTHDITARARFLREAEVSARLKHEHILPLFDFGEVDGRLFLVTPYIEGGTLAKHLRDSGPIPLQEVRAFFVPLAQAVAYIHRRGVVHRDLKPTNVMLDSEDGEIYVRLIDFGIASLQGQSASPPLTMAGHEMGTVAYMAPERLSGIAAPSNDIFSLGVMLTARMPVATPSPTSAAPRLPDPLAKVVRRSIAANPAERYATADELLKAFEQAYEQMMQSPPAPSPTPAPLPSSVTRDHARPASRPERVVLAHSGELPALTYSGERPALTHSGEQPVLTLSGEHLAFGPSPAPTRSPLPTRFAPEDYSAPTTAFRPSASNPGQPTSTKPPRSTPPGTRKKNPTVLLVSSISILILIIGVVLYGAYQTVAGATVSVNFTPRASSISQVFTIKADPHAQSVNAAQASIPAHVVTDSKSNQQSGDTTGQANCIFPGFGCQQAVSLDDVQALQTNIESGLQQSLKQDLQGKIGAAHGTPIGPVQFSTSSVTANPQVGSISQTVTVSVTVQGNAGYVTTTDVASLANQMLAAAATTQIGQGYQLVPATVNVGAAVWQAVDRTTGVSTLKVPAGAVARYQFTQTQLQALSRSVAGKTVAQAEAILKSQPGIDPASVRIHFHSGSSGQSMPGDPQHITFIPLNPTSQPSISLTPVAAIIPADTATLTTSPTATDNGN